MFEHATPSSGEKPQKTDRSLEAIRALMNRGDDVWVRRTSGDLEKWSVLKVDMTTRDATVTNHPDPDDPNSKILAKTISVDELLAWQSPSPEEVRTAEAFTNEKKKVWIRRTSGTMDPNWTAVEIVDDGQNVSVVKDDGAGRLLSKEVPLRDFLQWQARYHEQN